LLNESSLWSEAETFWIKVLEFLSLR